MTLVLLICMPDSHASELSTGIVEYFWGLKFWVLKNSLKCDAGLIVNIIIYSLAECTVHSCHVHVIFYSLSGGSLEPAVTSLETLQACCNFLWNNSGMSMKLSNFNFQWTKTLYQNNLNNMAFFFYIFQGP